MARSTDGVTVSQALVRHMLVAQPPSGQKPSSKKAPPAPAQTDTPWLPADSVAVSSTVAGYVFHAPVHAGSPKLGLARLLGAPASPAVQNVTAHVYRYVRRAVALWPSGQAKDALGEVLQLWLAVCLPWQVDDASCRHAPPPVAPQRFALHNWYAGMPGSP